MAIVTDLGEGILLFDSAGDAYVQPLLGGGIAFRVPSGRQPAFRVFARVLKTAAYMAVFSMIVADPRPGALVIALLLALHPAGVWLLSSRLQPAGPAGAGPRAERLLRLAHARGEPQILRDLSTAALIFTLSLALFGWGNAWAGVVVAMFGVREAMRNLPLLRALRGGVRTRTRVP